MESSQRLGIGKELFSAVVEGLVELGFQSMLIWVLEHNPARSFYEALGGKQLRKQTIEIGGAMLQEFAYGWVNIPA